MNRALGKLMLFGSCYAVRGFTRSVVCDLQYGKMNFVPNDLLEFLELNQRKCMEEIYQFYNNEENETVDEYVDFLIENDYVFFTDTPDSFPPLHRKWYSSALVTNVIIDICSENVLLNKDIVCQMDSLGVLAVQIRFKESIEYDKLDEVLSLFLNSSIRSLELVVKFSFDYFTKLPILARKHLRLSYIIVHSSPDNLQNEYPNTVCFYTKGDIEVTTGSGPRSTSHLAVNKQLFMEAQFHNPYLNKKLYINDRCEVSNAPNLPVLGNCLSVQLGEIVKKISVDNLWNVTKDTIRICKDCEFRYFCVDARIPRFDKVTREYYHEESCEYNPYNATWKFENRH